MKNRILSSLLIIVAFFLFLHPLDSGDFFHHIATGRLIVENLTLPFKDTFTFSAYGNPWVAHSWGSGVIYFLIYEIGGINGLNIFFAIIGATTLGFLTLLAKKYAGLSSIVFSFLFLTGVILSLYWPSRPLVWSPLLITILFLLFRIYKKYWYLVPLLFFLWSLLYGASSLFGLIIFALFLISQKGMWSKKNILILLLSFFVSCLNGYGLRSLFYGISGSSYMQAQEWLPIYKLLGQPLLPAANYQLLAYFVWFVVVGLIFFNIFKNHRNFFKKNVFESLLVLGIFAPFISFRFIPLVTILTFPFILLSLRLFSEKIMIIISRSILFFAVSLLIVRLMGFPLGLGIKNEKPLQDLVNFMRQNNIYGNVYSSQDLGGYVSWTMPESKVFIDTRDDLFVNTNVLRDRNAVNQGIIPITKLLDSYHVNIVIGKPSTIYRPLLNNPEWKFIYLKDYFVAVRNPE